MKLKTFKSSSQVLPLGFSVTLSSRSQPPLQDTEISGCKHSQTPSTSKAGAVGLFRRHRGGDLPCTHNDRVPWQSAGPGFHLTPQNVVGRQPSPLKLTAGTTGEAHVSGTWFTSHTIQLGPGWATHTPSPPAWLTAVITGPQAASILSE